MSEQVTRLDVAKAIDWLGGWRDGLDFDSADWSQVEESGSIYLEGRRGNELVAVEVRIVEVEVSRDWDAEDWGDDDDDDAPTSPEDPA